MFWQKIVLVNYILSIFCSKVLGKGVLAGIFSIKERYPGRVIHTDEAKTQNMNSQVQFSAKTSLKNVIIDKKLFKTLGRKMVLAGSLVS